MLKTTAILDFLQFLRILFLGLTNKNCTFTKGVSMNNIFQDALGVRQALSHGKRFTLVGGCFDLIHVGHVHLLEYAASLEELLVVAVLSDSYTRMYKDPL